MKIHNYRILESEGWLIDLHTVVAIFQQSIGVDGQVLLDLNLGYQSVRLEFATDDAEMIIGAWLGSKTDV